jgi:hypothetical protein
MVKKLVVIAAVLALLIWNDTTRNYLANLRHVFPVHYVSAYNDALIIVTGSTGRGSGFMCELEGQPTIITNAHVAAANTSFQLTNLKGTALSVGKSAVAVGRDIVKMEPATPPSATPFPVMEHVDQNANIGDAVVVLGNAEGANVVTSVEGKIVGIGPDLVEVDAPFVAGNSGSPIVHKRTGQVIGVATYLLIHNVDRNAEEGVSEKVRRFGYRLDSVKAWEPIDWPRFYAQAEALDSIKKLSQDFITLFKSSRTHQTNLANYKTPAMRRVIRTATQQGPREHRPGGVNHSYILGEIRILCRADVNAYNLPGTYDYFRRELEDQSSLRQAIYTALTQE